VQTTQYNNLEEIMFALRSKTEFSIRVFLVAAFLFNGLAPTTAAAMSSSNIEQAIVSTNSEGIKGSALKIHEGLSLRTALQQSTPIASPVGTITPTPELSGTPTSETKPTATAVPSQTGTPAPAVTEIAPSPAVDTPLLSLIADPDYLTADSKLALDWVIE
jgi:hypothetical protein